MGARGGYYALTPEQMGRVLVAYESGPDSDDAVEEALFEVGEELPARWKYSLDSAWDEIQRGLNLDDTPDNGIDVDAGSYPFCFILFGGACLYQGDKWHIYLIEPDTVAELASALPEVDEAWLRNRFFTIDPATSVRGIDEGSFDYLMGYFRGLPAYFAAAAGEGRAVVFMAGL